MMISNGRLRLQRFALPFLWTRSCPAARRGLNNSPGAFSQGPGIYCDQVALLKRGFGSSGPMGTLRKIEAAGEAHQQAVKSVYL